MNSIFILREIGKWDKNVWRLFSLLNKEMNEYFCVLGKEYELNFREIEKGGCAIYYLLDNKYHRIDGPAVMYNNGSESWYFNGKYHRLDGPARILENYCDWWYKNGKLHRTDGPAIEFIREDMKIDNQWWINGVRIK